MREPPASDDRAAPSALERSRSSSTSLPLDARNIARIGAQHFHYSGLVSARKLRRKQVESLAEEQLGFIDQVDLVNGRNAIADALVGDERAVSLARARPRNGPSNSSLCLICVTDQRLLIVEAASSEPDIRFAARLEEISNVCASDYVAARGAVDLVSALSRFCPLSYRTSRGVEPLDFLVRI